MSLKSSVFKVDLQICNMDSHYYASHQLTVARHPSETDQRMMARIAVFAIHASDRLQFCRGISDTDEPDLWQKNLTDEIEKWIELGQPDLRRIQQASAKSQQMIIYTLHDRSSAVWWDKIAPQLKRFSTLAVYHLEEASCTQLVSLVKRTMQLQFNCQDGEFWLGDENQQFQLNVSRRL